TLPRHNAMTDCRSTISSSNRVLLNLSYPEELFSKHAFRDLVVIGLTDLVNIENALVRLGFLRDDLVIWPRRPRRRSTTLSSAAIARRSRFLSRGILGESGKRQQYQSQ